MNNRAEAFLKAQAGKTAVICELADELLSHGALSVARLDEIERRAIVRLKNAEFDPRIGDIEQIKIIESGIDTIRADFAFLRERLRRVMEAARPDSAARRPL